MSNVNFSVPLSSEVKKRMDSHSDVKWVEVARRAIVNKLDLLEKMDALLKNSELTEEDVAKHAKIINQRVFESDKRRLGIVDRSRR